ncbi:ABC transporter ATP-binding protein [Clostridiales bacterium COT073_COT-073]|nr:ABC transporter ATP-binding protein [Clostridiales bacterium COT073_COT-073]
MDYSMEINGVVKSYPGSSFILDNIHMQIPYGKIIGLIGENGAGKTTLIQLILNQISADSGNIKIFGMNHRKMEKDIKSKIGFVMDECCFHTCLSAKEVGKILKYIYLQWNNKDFEVYLSRFEIDQEKRITELSKGMKNKLMLATALAHNPDILILDEITSGLDPVVRDDILNILKDFIATQKKSVFFSTHITSDLDKAADIIAFIHKGKLVFMEEKEKIKNTFRIYSCSNEKTDNIKNSEICAKYYENGQWHFLLKNSKSEIIGKEPTLDEIMLLFIKGGR